MPEIVISSLGVLALLAVSIKGVQWSFRWIYLPTLVLVPVLISWTIIGVPDLTPRRAVCIGIVIGAVITGKTRQLLPRWHWFDVLVLVPIVSFSISYGLETDFKGFYGRLAELILDWGCPYLLARVALKDIEAVRAALGVLAGCAVVMACLVVYECRMATRVAVNLWNMLGLDVPTPRYRYGWRWGYLRAAGTWGGGLPMASFFTTVTPLMVLWGLLLRATSRWKAWIATIASVAGCIAGLSRGPLVVLGALAMIFPQVARPKKLLVLASLAAIALVSPFVIGAAREEVRFTQKQMELYGNTTSGHYRVALLLIYGKSIRNVGPWGDTRIVGSEYPEAWSIDNAYLYFFFLGGWIGGGAFCLIIVTLFYLGARGIGGAVGRERMILSAMLASFAGVTGCMANLFFAASYTPLFWITAALVLNAVAGAPAGKLIAQTGTPAR